MNLKPYRSAIVTLCASLIVGGIFGGAGGSDAPQTLKALSAILVQSTFTTAGVARVWSMERR